MLPIKKVTFIKVLIVTSVFACSGFAQNSFADWAINNEASAVQFVSIKKDAIGEVHHFGKVSGTLTKTGALSATIDLSSVETGIDIRNSRMTEFLFEAAKFPMATISTIADPALLKSLETGKSQIQKMPLELTLHGIKVTLQAEVILTKLKGNKISAASTSPVLLNAENFGLIPGINKLKELASLPSIASSIPVTFQITFEPK